MMQLSQVCFLAYLTLASALFAAPAAIGRHAVHRPALRTARQVGPVRMEVIDGEEVIDEEEFMTEEEYLAEQEVELSQEAQKVVNNMKSESGVEFAPWMKVDAEAIAKAKKEREERKARAASSAKGDQMLIDPQAAELGAGGGLKSKVLSEEEVELRWSTGDETGNLGFIVQRRKGGSQNFEDIESFTSFAPLKTKGE